MGAFGGPSWGCGNPFWGRGNIFFKVRAVILRLGFELLEIFGVRFGVEASKSGLRALTSQKN